MKILNWKPVETDRICSYHFEHYCITKVDDFYELNNYAIPLIKPKVCIQYLNNFVNNYLPLNIIL